MTQDAVEYCANVKRQHPAADTPQMVAHYEQRSTTTLWNKRQRRRGKDQVAAMTV
ncbi:hypothetical protein RvY_03345 [Ramazzottius varieornatus]|uniref:Uncharacterized protein n=1 Tax=Ramazzottius varieornatus TaxID=947166 RepID=A0A1D1UUS2_RAMVA|nr:hypothetical protein RvY_03345 [Ramazzottius varieornatus]